ncbi:hypothetical protein EB796_009395 [Bugula neritina]|uniref:Uncharacterized protein n=1 Tax=Bugula neritina TaxID=10212 RepID=A0A7J7K2Y8_BUGNE|nr:hypothetical protein EB796_009395 [Bugula neritina]
MTNLIFSHIMIAQRFRLFCHTITRVDKVSSRLRLIVAIIAVRELPPKLSLNNQVRTVSVWDKQLFLFSLRTLLS